MLQTTIFMFLMVADRLIAQIAGIQVFTMTTLDKIKNKTVERCQKIGSHAWKYSFEINKTVVSGYQETKKASTEDMNTRIEQFLRVQNA